MNFTLQGSELEKFDKWNKKHKHKCNIPATTIEGRLTFSFTPTGLGAAVKVKCECGKEKNLTDYSKW